MSPERLSMRAYARRRGCSPQAVQKAVRAGRIRLVDGKIEPETADKDWTAHTRPAAARAPVSEDEQGDLQFNRARAVHEVYRARLARLEFEVATGKLVSADLVRARVFAVGRQARDRVLSLPDRLAPVIAGESDVNVIRDRLAEELGRICADLAVAATRW